MQYTLFAILAPLGAVMLFTVTLFVWRYRGIASVPSFLWLVGTSLGWLILNTLELLASTEAGTVALAKVTYIFITIAPLAWLAFALEYTGKSRWLTLRRFLPLCIIPGLTFLLAVTNELHGLIWQSYELRWVEGFLTMRVIRYGPGFWVFGVSAYIMVFIGALLVAREGIKSFKVYRWQSLSLLLGSIMPIVPNAIYILRLIPGLTKDYSPLSFAFGGILYAIGLLRFQLFDLKPIARDQLIDSMNDAMMVLDSQSRIVDLNPAAVALLRRPADEVVGKRPTEVRPSWEPIVSEFRDAASAQAEIITGDETSPRWYELRISPLSDRRGRYTGRLVVLHDITQRKQAEAERERLIADLDSYAHTVAHDLKNPLSLIAGYANLLQEDIEVMPPEEVQEALDVILRTAFKMTDIVNALLVLASTRRLDEVEVEPLDMAAILLDVQERLAHAIAESQAMLVMPGEWPLALGVGLWVEEVWVNYISNAIKYGGTPPRVELGAELQESGMVRFWVRDNGHGVDPKMRDLLFVEFTRLDTRRTEGHGLGLSIVKRIVEKLGGEVGVDSVAGQGSLFYFTLPAAPPDTAAPQPDRAIIAPAG
ncbi:MAG TPA: histidine kinase N-terminal 7TM domain-containing protein [Aggregatilineales bacterium]|nr:histidine kinase N-terminal 7TM domain-containing protein [Aggregatilineales bacterium]HQA68685.1 histidine kinase N-terminal 7TM domain-containing protein [Aggregatilineales bacterium]